MNNFLKSSLFLLLTFSASIVSAQNSDPATPFSPYYSEPVCDTQSRSFFHSAPEKHHDPFRSISFDTGYVISPYSNRAMSDFGVEFFQLHAFAFDCLNDYTPCGHFLARSLFFYGDLLFSAYIADVYLTTYHEFGHFTRMTAEGFDPFFVNRPNNFFGFFLEKFTDPFSGEATGATISTPLTVDQNTIIAAAGVNNEMRFAGDIADESYFNHGHITHLSPYVNGKLSSVSYPLSSSNGNDMSSVIASYNAKGYAIDKHDIDQANAFAFLLSSTTYNYLWSTLKYFYTAETEVNAWEFFGIRLPETESYLTTDGISLKVKSGYRYDDTLVFPVAYEFIIKGDTGHEVTLGARKKLHCFHDLFVSGNLIIGSALGANVSATLPLHKHFAITGGLEYFNSKTFHGERNITSSTPRTHNLDAWLKLSYLY